jgi:hypothetical protein
MKTIIKLFLCSMLLFSTIFELSAQTSKNKDWTNLLDSNLSQWDMYLSYKHKNNYNGQVPVDSEGKSLHIVNGILVMVLKNSRFWDGTKLNPLVEGKIQLQSEAGEVFYKEVMIKPINEMPNEFKKYFYESSLLSFQFRLLGFKPKIIT